MHTRESLGNLPRVARQRASLELACGPLVTPERVVGDSSHFFSVPGVRSDAYRASAGEK